MNNDSSPDYDDPDVEEAWCDARRQDVVHYMREQKVIHGRVGEWPAWHVPPVVSVWAIESETKPGAMGWWVICGDLPTDYLPAQEASDPREAVRAFAARWRSAAEGMRGGNASETISIGSTAAQRRELAPMLESRAKLLATWAERDDVWEGLFDDD